MKKTLLLMGVLLIISVMGATANHLSDRDGSAYILKSMTGGYALDSWVQFTDEKISFVSRRYQGYSHRSYRHDEAQVTDFLCSTWKYNNQCMYEIDALGRVRFVAVSNRFRTNLSI